jgi:hypothetical protein
LHKGERVGEVDQHLGSRLARRDRAKGGRREDERWGGRREEEEERTSLLEGVRHARDALGVFSGLVGAPERKQIPKGEGIERARRSSSTRCVLI